MAAQRQKLEQAVDAWRRDAEHWRARYDSLATPGAFPAERGAQRCESRALTVVVCAAIPAPSILL